MGVLAKDLIIVSNRLPCVVERQGGGNWDIRPGSGGLVTAMAPVLRNRGGIWIGWGGTVEEDDVDVDRLLEAQALSLGYSMRPVVLTRQEKEGFYHGFANEIIWPLFHSLDERCNFDPAYWKVYQTVNGKYAAAIRRNMEGREPYIWIHDYHLMLVGAELRGMGVGVPIAHFLHTPFPPVDIFLKLPWRFQVLRALMVYDLLGFQTARDRRNFVQCIRSVLPNVRVRGRGRIQVAATPEREVRLGAFPISIDYEGFCGEAADATTTRLYHRMVEEYGGRRVILGVDRLDYTKGIPNRLKAIHTALRRFPELRRNVTFVQIVVPSRESIDAYQALKEEIEELVGETNGEFTEPGWVPIHYVFRPLARSELLAYYRLASVMLVTPLNDGMNLVAKEYCACNLDENGVLILSEFAGAAAELERGAILINPYDIEGVAEAIARSLRMEAGERRLRMKSLRRQLRKYDVFFWLDTFLRAGFARRLQEFPPLDVFVPRDAESDGLAGPRPHERSAVGDYEDQAVGSGGAQVPSGIRAPWRLQSTDLNTVREQA